MSYELVIERTAPTEEYLRSPSALKWLESFADPEERLINAHELASTGWTHAPGMAMLRARRVYAIRVLRNRFGWRPTTIRQFVGGPVEKRRLVNEALNQDYDLVRGERPESMPQVEETEEWAKTLLRAAHHAVAAREDAAAVARAVRQDLVRAMIGSELWTNTDLQELTGMSSARVSQVLCGTANLRGNTRRARLDALEEEKQVAALTAALLDQEPLESLGLDGWVRDNLLFLGVYTVNDLEGWSRERLLAAGLRAEAFQRMQKALSAAGVENVS